MNSTKILEIVKEFSQISILKLNEEGYVKEVLLNSNTKINPKKDIKIFNLFILEDRKRVENLFNKGMGEETKLLQISKRYSRGNQYVNLNIKDIRGKTYAYLKLTMPQKEKEKELEIENKIQELSNIAETDHLTGLLNRHTYWDRVKRILNCGDSERKIGILFLDMDGLKEINTKLGHKGGDQAINQISSLISKSIRQRDIAVRYGGDEFVIVVEELSGSKSSALGLAKRIFKEINKSKNKYLTTVSIGVHVVKVGKIFKKDLSDISIHRNWEEEVVKADKLAYKAKEAGKNTIQYSKKNIT